MTTRPLPAARRPTITRSAALALALAWPACAHAQGEGLGRLLFGALLAVYVLVVLVALLVVHRRRWRPRAQALLALVLVGGPFVPSIVGGIAANLEARHQRALQAEETAQAGRYLEQACATQRVVPVGIVTIHGADGLFVSPSPALSLPDAPPWPTGASDTAIRHQRRYVTALAWTSQVFAPRLPLDHDFAFVEERETGATHLRAIAPHDWWQAHGLARLHDDRRPELLGVLASNDDARIAWDVDDDQPQARYRLELSDISTVEDRRHWVARGRMRLFDGRDGKLLAQYVGFSANLDSAAVADYGNAWERTLECPGPERAYALEAGAWRGVEFFFDRYVRVD